MRLEWGRGEERRGEGRGEKEIREEKREQEEVGGEGKRERWVRKEERRRKGRERR